MLTTTSHSTIERAPSGASEDGGVGSGVPARYDFTSRAFHALSPWNDATYTYSILQLQIGDNPLSNLQVASALNILNLGTHMYHYNYQNTTSRYYPKVYLGTSQTIAKNWTFDRQTGINRPSNWPQNSPQKGEANL